MTIRKGAKMAGCCEMMSPNLELLIPEIVPVRSFQAPESLRPPHSVKGAEASGSGHHRFAGGGYGRASGDTGRTPPSAVGSRPAEKYFPRPETCKVIETRRTWCDRRKAPP